MRKVSLKPRLLTAANMIRRGVRIADIGTDHAFLPIYCVQNNLVNFVVASDINIYPLENAKKNAAFYSCADRIRFVISNGLDAISPDDADDIIICGMGGELISEIIDGSEWLRDCDKHLILQPMTRANELRRYLCENGFEILVERAAQEDGRIYAVICARYLGQKIPYDSAFLYTGKMDAANDDFAVKYIRTQIEILKKAAEGMRTSKDNKCKADSLYSIVECIYKRYGEALNED